MTSVRSIVVSGLVAMFGAGSAIALSACSDDDNGNQEVSVKLTERDLDPGRVDVDAGTIDFEVRNDGDRLHAFAVRTPDGVERITEIKPGDSETLTVDLPVGRYRMYDPRGSYRLRGVSGTVVVTPDDDTDTVTERTVERTVVDEEPVVTVPETDDPEIQDPEIQEPPPAARPPQAPPPPPPPVVTQTVPAPPPPTETTP